MNTAQIIERFRQNINKTVNESELPITICFYVMKDVMREMEGIIAKELTEGVEKNAKGLQQDELAEPTE